MVMTLRVFEKGLGSFHHLRYSSLIALFVRNSFLSIPGEDIYYKDFTTDTTSL